MSDTHHPFSREKGMLVVISGFSGSGKGMYTKLELIQVFFGTSDVIIIIDPQNEYKEIADYLGGQFIDFGAQAEHYINPLDTETMKYMSNKRNFLSDKMDLMTGIFSQTAGPGVQLRPSLLKAVNTPSWSLLVFWSLD